MEVVLSSALPALFPSLVLSRMMTGLVTEGDGKKAAVISYLLGILCGFPVGCATVARFYQRGMLDQKDAERLLFCCNNTGAVFFVSYCGSVLGEARYGWILFFSQTILTLFFFLSVLKTIPDRPSRTDLSDPVSFSDLVSDSLSGAVGSFLFLSACILFFGFLGRLLLSLFPLNPIGRAVTMLTLELSGGVAKLKGLPLSQSFPLCAAGCGWAGISVFVQTTQILKEVRLSSLPYLLGKLTLAVLMSLISLIFIGFGI